MSNSTIPGQVGSDRLVFVEINANSAQLELRLWLSLAYYYITIGSILVTSNFLHRYINFTFIEAGWGGAVRKLVHMSKFGQKAGIFTYFQFILYLKQNFDIF